MQDTPDVKIARVEERLVAEREVREAFEQRLTTHSAEMRQGYAALSGKIDRLTGSHDGLTKIMQRILDAVVVVPRRNGGNGLRAKLQHPASAATGGAGGLFLLQQLWTMLTEVVEGGGVP